MTRRALLGRRQVSHIHVAAKLRNQPGEWQLVGTYPARYSAITAAHSVRTASRMPAYSPAGSFESRVETVGDETGVYARYIGSKP